MTRYLKQIGLRYSNCQKIKMESSPVSLPFVFPPMSDEGRKLVEENGPRYKAIQLYVLVAAIQADRIYAAYLNGWHMVLGMN